METDDKEVHPVDLGDLRGDDACLDSSFGMATDDNEVDPVEVDDNEVDPVQFDGLFGMATDDERPVRRRSFGMATDDNEVDPFEIDDLGDAGGCMDLINAGNCSALFLDFPVPLMPRDRARKPMPRDPLPHKDDVIHSIERARDLGYDEEPKHWNIGPGITSLQTLVYDDDNQELGEHAQEVLEVLCKTFKDLQNEIQSASVEEATKTIEARTKYKLKRIERCQQPQLLAAHESFARIYGIQDSSVKTVFHGTGSADEARSIATEGFCGLGRRTLWGVGVYTAGDANHALLYATPDRTTNKQHILVCRMYAGPTKVGSENLRNFGFTEEGKPINTTTDDAGTMFCCRNPSQVFADYIVTVVVQVEEHPTKDQISMVGRYHNVIWYQMQQKKVQQDAMLAGNVSSTVRTTPMSTTGGRKPFTPNTPTEVPAIKLLCGNTLVKGWRVRVSNPWQKDIYLLNQIVEVNSLWKDRQLFLLGEPVSNDVSKMLENVNSKNYLKPWHKSIDNANKLACLLVTQVSTTMADGTPVVQLTTTGAALATTGGTASGGAALATTGGTASGGAALATTGGTASGGAAVAGGAAASGGVKGPARKKMRKS